ncbi:hypothetical protein CERSUDRAFT_109509 [Gelatoporia subvermispora B]|uniref:DUF427 domain-containing protein n=1 Tax=Ceriporiopsis subvermispora (strain B) TaxID=914234 RepID=M2Q3G4_CERS8|nr:hypothetical protein CERSUDRAFT_109509 [Gelatoporia subvermispora B]
MAPPFTKPHIEDAQKRVRVLFNGKWLVDTTKAKLVWLKSYYPVYFFETPDVPKEYLISREQQDDPSATQFDLVINGKKADGVVQQYFLGELKDLVLIPFGAMDAWFEEEEQIFVHPKDPYKRVDVLQSSRHVRVVVNGVEVANTTKPRLLFETSLPVRTYIPKTDCRMDLLVPSDLTTQCPYKGVANYYSVKLPDDSLVQDIVWWYRTPQLECAEIRGYVAFYDEKVDVWVDGILQERAQTHF